MLTGLYVCYNCGAKARKLYTLEIIHRFGVKVIKEKRFDYLCNKCCSMMVNLPNKPSAAYRETMAKMRK